MPRKRKLHPKATASTVLLLGSLVNHAPTLSNKGHTAYEQPLLVIEP